VVEIGEFMRNLIITSALVAAFVGSQSIAQNQTSTPQEKEVMISVNDAYVPGGFVSNSDVFVVENGIFPNGCYRWSRADVSHPSQYVHEVRSIAKVSQGMCLMVLVPFTKEVHIGQIGAGNHVIRMVNGDGTYLEKDLKIEE
jgi:hypothetical protein